MFTKVSLGAAALALASTAAAQLFTLNVTGLPSYLASTLIGYTTLSYANSTAYLGQISQQIYSKKLLLSSVGGNGLAFQSWHTATNELQLIYINLNVTGPVLFTNPSGDVLAGFKAQGFGFDNVAGALINDGENRFIFCQDMEDSSLNSWELWWEGAGELNGVSCLVDVDLINVGECED